MTLTQKLVLMALLPFALLGAQWGSVTAYFERTFAHDVAIVAGAYCLAPNQWRGMIRQAIDEAAAPNTIHVECAADAL